MMILFSASQRNARRPRRIPSVAAVVRALGTVRVTDRPDPWTPRTTQVVPGTPYGSSSGTRDRGMAAAARRPG